MPKYKNSREAQVGDEVIGRDSKGDIVSGEVILCVFTGSRLIPAKEIPGFRTVDFSNLQHAEDVIGAKPQMHEPAN